MEPFNWIQLLNTMVEGRILLVANISKNCKSLEEFLRILFVNHLKILLDKAKVIFVPNFVFINVRVKPLTPKRNYTWQHPTAAKFLGVRFLSR